MAEKKQIAENGQPWNPSSPNGAPAKAPKVQSTINSFFKPKAPTYAMAPGSPPPAQPSTISIGNLRAFAPSFIVGAQNQAQADAAARNPENSEDWVRLSPPKVGDLDLGSRMDGSIDDKVVALDEDGLSSPSEQIRREYEATVAPIAARIPLTIGTGRGQKTLDARAAIIPIQPAHVTSIKRINGLLLCISYPPWFYQQLSPPTSYSSYSRAIMWTDKPGGTPTVIGSLITRRDPVTEFKRTGEKEGVKPDDTALYIAALTLLSPYRSKGLAQAALESAIRQIVATPSTQEAGGIKSLYAHVWTENTEGLDWYEKMGFHKEGRPVEGYYSRLSPTTAWVLRRQIGVKDNLLSLRPDGVQRAKGMMGMDRTGSESDSAGLDEKDLRQSTILKRPSANTARSFMSKGPENEWNDLPQEMVLPRSGTASAARTPGTSAPPSGPPSAVPSRTPSVAPPADGVSPVRVPVGEGAGGAAGARKKKKSRAYAPAAINGVLVNGSGSRDGSLM